jgi:hypothetical protein
VRPRFDPRDRLAALVTGGAVLVGAVLGIVLAGAAGAVTPTEAVEDFAEAQADRDYAAAYELLCLDSQRSWESPREFARVMRESSNPLAEGEDFEVGDLQFHESDGRVGFAVDVEVTGYADLDHLTLFVVRQRGEFRVCGSA